MTAALLDQWAAMVLVLGDDYPSNCFVLALAAKRAVSATYASVTSLHQAECSTARYPSLYMSTFKL